MRFETIRTLRLLLVIVATPLAAAALDHFTVYGAFGQIDPPLARFQDQFQLQDQDLGPTRLFLVPADKNGEGIENPSSHLTCYEIADGVPAPPQVIATHQFGTQPLALGTSAFACIPTEKFPPAEVSLDHYVCYQANGDPTGVTAGFRDQFYAAEHEVLSPFLFCAPAVKNDEQGLIDPRSHLTCFDIAPVGPGAESIPIRNQFGADELDVTDRRAVCLPSLKEVPPPGVTDHFLYYRALGPDGPPVTVEDQFGPLLPDPDLGAVTSFLVPADKNDEGIVDPISHLTGYAMSASDTPPPPAVVATNQFGSQELVLEQAVELLVPTEKLLPGHPQGPPSIDHFACYPASGKSLDLFVTVSDQFQPDPVGRFVREPMLFCNPANKNGEGIVNEDDHLACFRLDPAGAPVGFVPISNQFGEADLDVQQDVALCLPSTKTIVPPPVVPGVTPWQQAALAMAVLAISLLAAWRIRTRAQGRAAST